jgi:FkbM family methyltransferase
VPVAPPRPELSRSAGPGSDVPGAIDSIWLLKFVSDTPAPPDDHDHTAADARSDRVFVLERYAVHPGATVRAGEPFVCTTPREPWSYAVSFLPAWPPGFEQVDGLLRVRLRVREGEISLISLAADEMHTSDETLVPASDGIVEAVLVVTPLTDCAQLVVRNARSATGSVAEVHTIEQEAVCPVDYGDRLSVSSSELRAVSGWSRFYGRVGLTIDERIRSVRYGTLDRVKRMPWFEGLELYIRPNEELSRAVYVSGTYEPASLLAMKRILPEGGVFIDVGANVGLYSMLASRWVGPGGRVFCLEPSEREFQRLLAHLKLNRLENVVAIRQAVVERCGPVDLRVAEYPHAGHNTTSEQFVYGDVAASHSERVEGTTLDHVLHEARIDRVDLVKIDVEGGEHSVLAGATRLLRDLRPSWIVELSSRSAGDQAPPASLEVLFEARYRVFCLDAGDAPLVEIRAGETAPSGNVVAVPEERSIAADIRG